VRLYDSLPDAHPEELRGVSRRKSGEAQFDDLECRGLLDAGGAEYRFCRAAVNFGVPDVSRRGSASHPLGQQSGCPLFEVFVLFNFDISTSHLRLGNPVSSKQLIVMEAVSNASARRPVRRPVTVIGFLAQA
jgi:hypothetical protein